MTNNFSKNDLRAFYDQYHETNITINKKVIVFLKLIMQNIIFKTANISTNCILYSLSMNTAMILLNVDKINISEISSKICALKLAFQSHERKTKIFLHIDVKVTGSKQFNSANNKLSLIYLSFCKAPPDDLISIIGSYLKNQQIIEKRKEERIIFNEQTKKRMGFFDPVSVLSMNNAQQKCIIKDISYSGSLVIVKGDFTRLINAPVTLSIIENIKNNRMDITGTIIRSDIIAPDNVISALGLHFDEDKIPVIYHNKIAEYLSSYE